MSQRILRPFIVDGDAVRKHVSVDLGYSEVERNIQILRIFGIGHIAFDKMYYRKDIGQDLLTLSK